MTPKEVIQRFSVVAKNPVELAGLIAHHFHEGQIRKVENEPYIVHPARIVAQCENETDKCIAWLHDAVEDSECSLEDLEGFFSPAVIIGVATLTKIEGNDEATLEKIKQAPENIQKIKLLDVLDYWRYANGMSEASIEMNRKKTEEFYLDLALKLGEMEIKKEIEQLISKYC